MACSNDTGFSHRKGWAPVSKRRLIIAKNTGIDFRRGAVTGRTQFRHENGDWQKRDERTGQFMERKSSPGPFKGVAKEPDGRDTPNS
jgi:hypothetical protein